MDNEDDPEFSSPGSVKQLPRRTHTDIVEDVLTQLSKVEGYGQILHQEFGCLAATPSAPAKGEADGGDDGNDFQFEVERLVSDGDHEEKAPTIPPADLSACVVFVSCFSYKNNIIIQMYTPFPASHVQDSDSPLEAEPKKPKYYHIAFVILTTERMQVLHA